MEKTKDKLLNFRAQALCIKTNVQILKDLWILQNEFKEKKAGAFYMTVQENCIFRIVLETYKMLYDKTAANMITNMAKSVYQEMLEMEGFKEREQELLNKRKFFSSRINSYNRVKEVIVNNRNKVYAHNEQKFHWFSQSHTESWEMTDIIYDGILEISEMCIKYCNELLELLGEESIYEYSNHDDVKRLFGIKTEKEEIHEYFYGHKK